MKHVSYIEPNFSLASSYKKLQELYRDDFSYSFYESDEDSRISFNEILNHKLVFIVAEPGQGKTRLIDELLSKAVSSGKNVQRADLKSKLDDYKIDEWLAKRGVSSETEIVILDGFDEAPAKNINTTIYSLVDYIKNNPTKSFYISSRIHYFTKYVHNFSELTEAEFLLIKPLRKSRAKVFLRELHIQEGVIEKLFSSLQFGERVSILQNPRYLEMIANEVMKPSFDINRLNRSRLFESFISSALGLEDRNANTQIAEYKKRLLELLALTMEVAQINEITTDDFVTFMERAKSDLKQIVTQVDIENIYEHSLLNKDINGTISFTNSEVQEYLAAKYLMRMANPERKVFSVAVEPQLRQIIPTWRNTLSFIVDELPQVAKGIVDLKSNRLLLDESTEELVTGCTSGEMKEVDKNYIFDYIWKTNGERQYPLGKNITFNLASYADDMRITQLANSVIYAKNLSSADNKSLSLIRICGDFLLLDRYAVEIRRKVVRKLIRIAVESDDTTVQAAAVYALKSTRDPGVVKDILVLADSGDDQLFSAVELTAYELSPNSLLAIDLYIKGMKRSDLYIARMALEEINTKESVGYFLSKLAIDNELIEAIIDHDKMFVKEGSKFFENVERLWDEPWLVLLKRFILQSFSIKHGYFAQKSVFVNDVINFVAHKDPTYYKELLDDAVKNKELLIRMDGLLAKIMKPTDVGITIEAYKRMGRDGFLIFRIFECVLGSGHPYEAQIRSAVRGMLPEELKEYNKRQQKFIRQRAKNNTTARFQKVYAEIDEAEGEVNRKALGEALDIIVHYLQDSNTRKEGCDYSEHQIQHIWELLKELVLDLYDTTIVKGTVTKNGDGQSRYTRTQFAQWYEAAVVFGYLTKRTDLGDYKDKLLALFPYMFAYQKDEILSSLNLTKEDEIKIIAAYKDVSSDQAQFQPGNFIEQADRRQWTDSVDILREFTLMPHIAGYLRLQALRVAERIRPDKGFLNSVRDKYMTAGDEDSNAMLLLVDELLIVGHHDVDAIDRRFELLKDRASIMPARSLGVMYSVSEDEAELNDKRFAKPLTELRDPVCLSKFLDLLDFSFAKNQESEGWYRYVAYLWDVTSAYFGNLSSTKDVRVLNDIQAIVNRHPARATTYYIRHYNALASQYLEQIGGKKPYINAINIVNKINSTDELEITTSEELLYEVKDLIAELGRWIIQEGSDLTQDGEVDAQINIAHRLESILFKKFGQSDIFPRIERETQAPDGTRTDFYVYFGFIGPIIIELKLSNHKDLLIFGDQSKKTSYRSMKKYMSQFDSTYGVLLVFKTKAMSESTFQTLLANTRRYYEQIEGVSVLGLKAE